MELKAKKAVPPQPGERPKILRRPLPQELEPAKPDVASSDSLLVPASVLGQLLYCERSMYLGWVQGEAEDNEHLIEGRHAHRQVDTRSGDLPKKKESREVASDAVDAPTEARALTLSSERLGIIARVDFVQGKADGTVVPIEYKRGKVPVDVPGGVYPSVRVQVGAQALLLREHGYTCEEGGVYYAGSKRHVALPIDDELTAETRAAVARARALAAAEQVPPPLVDSPKCTGCSLHDICMPDELVLLRRLEGVEPSALDADEESTTAEADNGESPAAAPLRHVQPARDDRVPVYVTEHSAKVRVSGERLAVVNDSGTVHARLANTSQVVIFGNAQVTTQALRALLVRGIPVTYFTTGGYYVGRAQGQESNNVELRLAQYRLSCDGARCLQLARVLVASKIRNGRVLLRRNGQDVKPEILQQLLQAKRQAEKAQSLPELLGIEGAAARAYFSAFGSMFKGEPGEFAFEGRNRRPPRDPVNALLSLAYALLTKEYAHTLSGVGLDPMLGFYHQPRFGRPALALDLMEELRPVVADSVVLHVLNNRVVEPDDFVQTATDCTLRPKARKQVIAAYERRLAQEIAHPLFGYRISYRRVLEVQARLLSRVLLGELQEYPTFSIR